MSLTTWFMVRNWSFFEQFSATELLDRLDQAGVRGLVCTGALPLEPNPTHYVDCPITPQAPAAEIAALAPAIRAFFRAARDRGMRLFTYNTNPHAGAVQAYGQLPPKHVLRPDQSLAAVESYWAACANGHSFLPYYLGRIRDVQSHWPEIEGFITDGPEFGYEITPGFMNDNWSLFTCFGPCCQRAASSANYDFDELKRAASALSNKLHNLNVATLEAIPTSAQTAAEVLAALAGDPLVEQWFAFKSASIATYVRDLCQGVKDIDPKLQMGIGARLPAFAPLSGYDLPRLAPLADFVLPKIYLWMGGVDGLYGTVYRWAKTLKDWNPDLPEDVLLQFVFKLFGFVLPHVHSLADLTRHIEPPHQDTTTATYLGEPLPRRFFSEIVETQVRQVIEWIGDAQRVRPWFDDQHGGRVLTPHELDLALAAAVAAGLATYLTRCPLEDRGWWEVTMKYGS
jgi:hypothetical protein